MTVMMKRVIIIIIFIIIVIVIMIIIIVQRVQYDQTTHCIENSAVRKSYRATVQSAEIISIISDS